MKKIFWSGKSRIILEILQATSQTDSICLWILRGFGLIVHYSTFWFCGKFNFTFQWIFRLCKSFYASNILTKFYSIFHWSFEIGQVDWLENQEWQIKSWNICIWKPKFWVNCNQLWRFGFSKGFYLDKIFHFVNYKSNNVLCDRVVFLNSIELFHPKRHLFFGARYFYMRLICKARFHVKFLSKKLPLNAKKAQSERQGYNWNENSKTLPFSHFFI